MAHSFCRLLEGFFVQVGRGKSLNETEWRPVVAFLPICLIRSLRGGKGREGRRGSWLDEENDADGAEVAVVLLQGNVWVVEKHCWWALFEGSLIHPIPCLVLLFILKLKF